MARHPAAALKRAVIVTAVVLVALLVAARLAVPRLSSEPVATGVVETDGVRALGDCPGTPNCVGSEASDPERRTARLRVGAEGPAAIDRVAAWVEAQGDADVVAREPGYLHATFRSRLMGYADDVEFLAMPDGTVGLRSASRLGRSDLGANARRAERIRAALETG